MDYLKTQAPFWKKEHTKSGSRWVHAKTTDINQTKVTLTCAKCML
jgi:molybdopterin synthase catalytic subunit